ncbi:MAG: carbohydrate ABC transporter substrate-binding protein [Alphaproteobacteria bacterium]|nr:MAG: carbohydrate ABC transporter substrate-binding protein [Alphaproteobacteria bacterium]
MRGPCGLVVCVVALVLGAAGPAPARTLIINANTSDPAPRAAWSAAVAAFERENPDIQVKFNIYDHESYKKSIRNWLTGASPDVVFWFAGNRMRGFVERKLLTDVSSLFTADVTASLHRPALDLVTVGGRQYGVPYSYYQVGLYFRADLLQSAGIAQAPRDWNELLAACDRLKSAGIDPVAIGSKDLWPTAAWFDYLNLRTNGHAFHMALMAGTIPYTDPRVRAVFDKWRALLERGCFTRNHASLSWQESQALLYQGRAAMMLIGNYIVPNFPSGLREKMDFARFPTIDPGVGRYEDAPMNSLHIPAGARNKDGARRFLAYVLRADVQEAINRALSQLPVNLKAGVADDPFLAKGQALLRQADGLAQYFDRDTSEDLALIAMKGFQEFMIEPERIESVLAAIEQARKRIYGH